MSTEQSFREALARIAAGFYTEKGAENHAKDILRLVDSQQSEAVSSKERNFLTHLLAAAVDPLSSDFVIGCFVRANLEQLRALVRNADETSDEPPVMGAGGGPAPMPTPMEGVEAHVRQIEIICDAAGMDPYEFLVYGGAEKAPAKCPALPCGCALVNGALYVCPTHASGKPYLPEKTTRDLTASEAESFDKTLARSPRRVDES